MLKYLPRRIRPVTLVELSRAWTQTWHELGTLGFACPRLATCEV